MPDVEEVISIWHTHNSFTHALSRSRRPARAERDRIRQYSRTYSSIRMHVTMRNQRERQQEEIQSFFIRLSRARRLGRSPRLGQGRIRNFNLAKRQTECYLFAALVCVCVCVCVRQFFVCRSLSLLFVHFVTPKVPVLRM